MNGVVLHYKKTLFPPKRTDAGIAKEKCLGTVLGCLKRVEHQHANGHRPYPTRHGRDVGAEGGYILKVNIATKTEAFGTRGIGHARGAYIDDYGSFLDHVGRDKARSTNGGNDDVGLATLFLERRTVAVANGDSGVAILLLHHKKGHGFAHNVGTSEHHTAFSTRWDVVAFEQFDDAFGGGRNVAWKADGHLAHIDWRETIDIFGWRNALCYLLFGDVLGKGQLNDETIYRVVGIEAVNALKKFLFSDIALIAYE